MILFVNDKDLLVWTILNLILINTWLLLYNIFFLVKNDLNLFFGCKIFLITLKYKNYWHICLLHDISWEAL